jgi:hypothetical protein
MEDKNNWEKELKMKLEIIQESTYLDITYLMKGGFFQLRDFIKDLLQKQEEGFKKQLSGMEKAHYEYSEAQKEKFKLYLENRIIAWKEKFKKQEEEHKKELKEALDLAYSEDENTRVGIYSHEELYKKYKLTDKQ